MKLGKAGHRKSASVTSTASVQGLSSPRLSNLLGGIRDRASEEIKICLRNARADVCRSRLKAGFSGEEQVDL